MQSIVDLKTADGRMPLFVYKPEAPGPRAAVIVIQEIFGVNRHIQAVAERLAEAGYVAVAPDIFYRSGPKQIIPYSDMAKGMELAKKMTSEGLQADLKSVLAWLEEQPDVRPDSIGMVGFCLGGRVSFMSAASLPLKAAGVFYGGGLVPHPGMPNTGGPSGLDAAPRVGCPIISFWGGQDQHIPRADIRTLEEAVDKSGHPMTTHVYEQADHGFMCEDRASYNADAAADAWPKLLTFLRTHLDVQHPAPTR